MTDMTDLRTLAEAARESNYRSPDEPTMEGTAFGAWENALYDLHDACSPEVVLALLDVVDEVTMLVDALENDGTPALVARLREAASAALDRWEEVSRS